MDKEFPGFIGVGVLQGLVTLGIIAAAVWLMILGLRLLGVGA